MARVAGVDRTLPQATPTLPWFLWFPWFITRVAPKPLAHSAFYHLTTEHSEYTEPLPQATPTLPWFLWFSKIGSRPQCAEAACQVRETPENRCSRRLSGSRPHPLLVAMKPCYSYSVEQLRRNLILETNLGNLADQFLDITEEPGFMDDSHAIAPWEARQTVYAWLSWMEHVLTDTPHRDPSLKTKSKSSGNTKPRLEIGSITKLKDSDLFHGWGFHQPFRIAFFFFMNEQKGLVIRTRLDSHIADFFRFSVLGKSECQQLQPSLN